MCILSAMIDTREPAWIRDLTFGGVPTAAIALEAGDVQIATDDAKVLVIERKTGDDLLNTIRGGRLFPQCAKMLATSAWAYLVVCGQLTPDNGHVKVDGIPTGWTWASYQGALLTCQEMGIGVVQVPSDTEFEAAVIRLAARDRGSVPIRPPRVPNILSSGEAIIAALPGIGLERMQAVMEYAGGNAAWALTWLTELDNGDHIPGVNIGTKQSIRRALGLEDWAQLSVISREKRS